MAGGANSLTPTNYFNDLDDFTDILISHLIHYFSSYEEKCWLFGSKAGNQEYIGVSEFICLAIQGEFWLLVYRGIDHLNKQINYSNLGKTRENQSENWVTVC